MLGTLNFIEGIAAVGNSHFFANNTHYICRQPEHVGTTPMQSTHPSDLKRRLINEANLWLEANHMSLRWRRSARGKTPVCDPGNMVTHDNVQSQTEQLQEWRTCARRVTLAWNAWLAADRCDRDACYRTFVSALAEEARAAGQVERMVQASEAIECANPARSGQ